MGLFSGIKDLFNKNIECGDELDDHIVLFLKGKKYLFLGKNILVRDNSACVIAYKNKVCDVLLPGKYKIAQDSIPECYAKSKVEKKLSKGKSVKKIKVKIFYVNTTEFKDFDFCSHKPFVTKHKEIGKIKGCLCGKCTIRAIDPLLLIKYVINKTTKYNDKQILNILSDLIGNKINRVFEKTKIPFEMLFTDRNKVNSILNTEIEDSFDKNGIFVKNIVLKSMDVIKKHQGKVNNMISTLKKSSVPSQNVNPINSIGDSFKIPVNTQGFQIPFKVCRFCGCKNTLSATICTKCSNRLN